jgi:hypothetical protein
MSASGNRKPGASTVIVLIEQMHPPNRIRLKNRA